MTHGGPAPPASPAVYFASDYGAADEFVGVVHAVLHRFAPLVPVIDLGHEIPAFDVRAGADLLLRCRPVLGPGVVVGVVDPGVGSDRRAVVLRTTAAPGWLVGPDNGLLLPLAHACGGIVEARAIDRPRAASRGWSAARSRTFDGRDLFAPAAAHLVRGGAAAVVGPELDPGRLVRMAEPTLWQVDERGGIVTAVRWVDRFGNVQLGLGPDELERHAPPGTSVAVALDRGSSRLVDGAGGATAEWDEVRIVRRVSAFADLGAGELGLLVDANGCLSLVADRASAAALLGRATAGSVVRLGPAGPMAPSPRP